MGTVVDRGHAWDMTTSTLKPALTPALTPARSAADRVPVLALVAPLLLFTHGIALWVDGLDDSGGRGPLAVTAGALLVLSTAAFAWLATSLGARAEHLPVAVPTGLVAAFGAGATGSVWLGRLTGFLPETVPAALGSGGQVLTALALGLALSTTMIEGRMPARSLALAGGAAVVLALPWGLEPLGALVLLIALAPLTRPVDPR